MKRAAAASTAAALVLVGSSAAAWSSGASGSGKVGATTMGAGNAPTASAPTLSTNVTVSWAATSYGNGAQVGGYIIRRFNSVTGAEAVVGTSCSGIRSGLSCTESGVTPGSWTYSVTPAQGNWRGTEGPHSAVVTVPGL